jgi:hypothetical protein
VLSAATEQSAAVPGRRLGKRPAGRRTSSWQGRGAVALEEEAVGRRAPADDGAAAVHGRRGGALAEDSGGPRGVALSLFNYLKQALQQ